MEPHGVTVGPFESGVDIDETLDKVLPSRDVADALERESE
jgi:hypothetical protein